MAPLEVNNVLLSLEMLWKLLKNDALLTRALVMPCNGLVNLNVALDIDELGDLCLESICNNVIFYLRRK